MTDFFLLSREFVVRNEMEDGYTGTCYVTQTH